MVEKSPWIAYGRNPEAMMATVHRFDEAEANLAKLLDQLEAGEKVPIARSG